MPERFVILSDLHLGCDPDRFNPDILRPVWAGASHLIVNGDVAELHDPRFSTHAVQQTLHLEALCHADGLTLTLLAGNHDPGLTPRRHVFLADGRILITHGDAIHPPVPPWCPSGHILRKAYGDAMASLPVDSHHQLESRLWAAHHAAHIKWQHDEVEMGVLGFLMRPVYAFRLFRYWKAFPAAVEHFARFCAPTARFVILGHTHHPGIWTVGQTTVINTGCYGFPGHPRAAVLEGDQLTVWRLRRRRGLYGLADRPVASFRL